MMNCNSCGKRAKWEVSTRLGGFSYVCGKHLESIVEYYDDSMVEVYTSPIYVRSLGKSRELPKPEKLFAYFTPENDKREEALFYLTGRRPLSIYLEAWPLRSRIHSAYGNSVTVMGVREFAPTCLLVYGGRAQYDKNRDEYIIIYSGALVNNPSDTHIAVESSHFDELSNVIDAVGEELHVDKRDRQSLLNNLPPEHFELWGAP